VSVLLGKADGFEGQMRVVKPAEPHGLPLLDGPYMSLRVLNVCTAPVSSRSHDGDKDHIVSDVKEVTGFKHDCLEAISNVRPRGVECITAHSRSRLHGVVWVDPLDIRMEKSGRCERPGFLHRHVDATNDLHVLMRHRPHSISQPGRPPDPPPGFRLGAKFRELCGPQLGRCGVCVGAEPGG
jgi:hypothetical protein